MKDQVRQQWDYSRHKKQLAKKIKSNRRELKLAGGPVLIETDNIRRDLADIISGALQPGARASWPNLENLAIEVKA